MTRNQIAFAQYQETQRHNAADESIRSRTNDINSTHYSNQDAIGYASNAETKRHNTAVESNAWYTAQNLAALQQAQGNAALEQAAAATQRNEIASRTAAETERHNVASEQLSASQQDIQLAGVVVNGFTSLVGAGARIGSAFIGR